jgi:hypothetical protein
VNVSHFISSFLAIKLLVYKKAVNGQNIPKKHRDEKDSKPSCAFPLVVARGTFHCPESLTAYGYGNLSGGGYEPRHGQEQ